MSTLLLGTRKGLFIVERDGNDWKIEHTAFLGTQVPMLLPDARDGSTGSVWISENGGDDWQRLSADLPPIYCVRFAT